MDDVIISNKTSTSNNDVLGLTWFTFN